MASLVTSVWGPFLLLVCASACDPANDAAQQELSDAGSPESPDAEQPAPSATDGDADELGYYTFPCLGVREPSHAATFEAVYVDVFCKAGCVTPYCHGSRGAWADLDMTSLAGAYDALVEMPSGNTMPVDGRSTCRESELLRVEPYAPERSLLYLKVSGSPPCGSAMPPPEADRAPLTAEQADQVRRWIQAGAPLRE